MTQRHSQQLIFSVAQAWASIDGKSAQFCMARDPQGTFEGYMTEAAELLDRTCNRMDSETLMPSGKRISDST
jgi:hypothetical protein